MTRNLALDTIKAVACLGVIYIHSQIKEDLHPNTNYILAITRLAVPLFFMISGYYYSTIVAKGKSKPYFSKILKLTAIATIFYVCLFFTELPSVSSSDILNWALLNATPLASHLWYLYAMIYVLIIADKFPKFVFHKDNWKIALALIAVNYVLSSFLHMIYYRNFLLTGLPYFIFGIAIFQHKEKLIASTTTFRKSLIILVGLLILLMAEEYIYAISDLRDARDHFLLTAPLCLYIFLIAVRHPQIGFKSFGHIGQKYSSNIYIYHFGVMYIIDLLYNHISLPYDIHNYLYPVAIMTITTVMIFIFKKIIPITEKAQ